MFWRSNLPVARGPNFLYINRSTVHFNTVLASPTPFGRSKTSCVQYGSLVLTCSAQHRSKRSLFKGSTCSEHKLKFHCYLTVNRFLMMLHHAAEIQHANGMEQYKRHTCHKHRTNLNDANAAKCNTLSKRYCVVN